MEVESAVAESVRVTKDGMKYDAACKRVLSNKVILAHIMKSCVSEYRDCEIHEIVEKYIEGQPQVGEVPVSPDETNAPRIHGICNEDTSLTEGRVTYDIRFFAVAPVSGELVRLIIQRGGTGETENQLSDCEAGSVLWQPDDFGAVRDGICPFGI